MRGGRLTAVFSTAVLLLAGAPALAHADTTDADGTTSSAARQPVTVSLPITTADTPGRNGQNGVITMRVGRSAPIRVIVDTGFSGLLLFPGAWDRTPGGVKVGKTPGSIVGPDGSRIPGVMGSATMTFSGATTVTALPFLQATGRQAYLQAWEREGVYGLLGLGTKGGGSMVNPLTALPGDLGLRWSIHFDRNAAGEAGRPGRLVLGAVPPTDAVMAFPMTSTGTNANGAALWNDQAIDACWKFGTMAEMCVPTQFDAAFTVMRAKGFAYNRLPVNARGMLRPGTRIEFSAPDTAFVGQSLVAGNQASRNLVRVISTGSTKVITSNALYFDYTVTYNVATGHVYLSDPVRRADAR